MELANENAFRAAERVALFTAWLESDLNTHMEIRLGNKMRHQEKSEHQGSAKWLVFN